MHHSGRLPLVVSIFLLVLSLLAGCGGGSSGGGGGITLTAIEVTPAAPSLAAGTQVQLVATGIYSDDSTADLTEDVTWTSSDPAVASVDDTMGTRGITQAAVTGSVTVTATLDTVAGEVTLTVTAAVLVSLEVTPTNPSIALGTSEPFLATGIFSDGSKQDLTASVTWSSSDPGIATSAAGGLATSVATGTATITATQDLVSGTSDLTVTPAVLVAVEVSPTNPSIALGTGQAFEATGIYSDGTKQDHTATAVWSSDATAIADVDGTGAASSLAQGAATITADVGGTMGSSTLTVTAATLVSIGVTPAAPSVPLGLSQQLVATGVYTDASVQDLSTQVTWSSSDGAVLQVSNAAGSRGLATSLATGTATVSASLSGVAGSTAMTVTAATIVTLSVTPESPTLPLGTQGSLQATGIYTDGSTQDLTAVAVWSSSNTAITTVSNAGGTEGEAATVAVGSATVTATHLGVSGSTTLTVGAATLVSLEVSPSNLDLPLGLTQQFTATGIYTDASTRDLTATVVWASTDPAVLVVANGAGFEGLATSLSTGPASVSATLGAVNGSTPLTVSTAILTSLDVSAEETDVPLGFTESLVATGFYSDGSSTDLTASATWSSSDPAIATISNAPGSRGLLSTSSVGTTTVTASFGGFDGTADMTVTSAVLVSIEVFPDSPSVPLGNGEQFTATGTYSDASTQDLTASVTWITSDPMVATVSNATRSEGLVTAVGAGTSMVTASLFGTTGVTTLTVTNVTLTGLAVTSTTGSTLVVGTQAQLTATATFSDASTTDVTATATWSSSDPGLATVGNATLTKGLADGLAEGTVTLTAAFGGLTADLVVDVVQLDLVSITVTPADQTVAPRDNVQYTATGTFNDLSTQDLTASVTWKSSDNPTVGMNGDGRAKAHKEGTVTISATLGAIVGTTTLTVTP